MLGHCCPHVSKPLPNCLGDWVAEHDMAEGGQLLLTGCMQAGVCPQPRSALGASQAAFAPAAHCSGAAAVGVCLEPELDEAESDASMGRGSVWCSPDARRTWLIWLRLDLAMIPGSCPTRLKVANATVLITILCWPDGWPHGADSVWQACDDALQCAQAAGSCPDDTLVGRLAAEAPISGVGCVPAIQACVPGAMRRCIRLRGREGP